MSSSDRHQTVHYRRRPPLPGRDSEHGPPPNRGRRAAIVIASVLTSLGAGYASATWLGGGSEEPALPRTTTAARTTTSIAPAARPAVTRTPAGTLTAAPQDTPPPAAAAPVPGASPAGTGFDAPIPSDWAEREFAAQKAGYLQSRWDDPKDPSTYVIIDWSEGDARHPADAAVTLRAAIADRTDYREIRFESMRGEGWIWVYTILDERGRRAARIDLLSRRCGVLFAVLGSTSPKRFARLQRTFVAISRGIRVTGRRC